jgi:hypothetical protein
MMLGKHISERFFQRYGLELTIEILRELKTLAAISTNRKPSRGRPDVEEVTVHWEGIDVTMAWVRRSRTIVTFFPQKSMYRLAWTLPKKKKHVHGTRRKR